VIPQAHAPLMQPPSVWPPLVNTEGTSNLSSPKPQQQFAMYIAHLDGEDIRLRVAAVGLQWALNSTLLLKLPVA